MWTLTSFDVTNLGGGNWNVKYTYTNADDVKQTVEKDFTSGAEALAWAEETKGYYQGRYNNLQNLLSKAAAWQDESTFCQTMITTIQAEIDANT